MMEVTDTSGNLTNHLVGNSTDNLTGNPTDCIKPLNENALFEFVTSGILINLVGLFGLFGNLISMIILSRPQMKSSINYLLIGLARCDTILIVISVLLYGIPGIYSYTELLFNYMHIVYPRIVKFVYPLSGIVQMVTVYLSLTVTMERYIAVSHPLKARSFCTYGRTRIVVLCIVVFSVVYHLPRFFEVDFEPEIHWKYNLTMYCVKATPLRENPLYINVYVNWLYLVFFYANPFGTLVIFNTAIYRLVQKANRDLQHLSRNQRREIGLATMLLCDVTVFIICNILSLMTNIYEAFYDKTSYWLVQLGNLMVTINSSVNFIIYVIFNRKFRQIFLTLFCRSGLFGLAERISD